MQYPSDWKKVEPGQFSQTNNFNIIVGFLSPKESASSRLPPAALSVGIHNLSPSQSITLDQYSGAQTNFIKEQASILESTTITLKGNNNTLAHKIVYINNKGQKIMQVWTIKGDKAYHITYAANADRYSDYLPSIQKMIGSFEIVGLIEFNNNNNNNNTNSIQSIAKSDGTETRSSSSLSSAAADGYITRITTTEAAAPSDFNFAAAGDWGCTDDTINTVDNMVDKKPELVLALGDFSYEPTADCWLDVIQPIDNTIDNAMKIVIGNHDIEDLQNYMNHFGLTKEYYSFDFKNVHFIALGTEEEYLDFSNDIAKEQLAFVKSDLEKASTNPDIDWIIPFFHRLMYYDDQCDNLVDEYDHNLVDVYHPLFEKYGVNLVLHGHAHTYERSYPLKFNPGDSKQPIVTDEGSNNYRSEDGLVIATVGTGGAKFTETCLIPELAAVQYANLFGFLNVDVSSDGRTLVGTFYDNADGEIKDTFAITK